MGATAFSITTLSIITLSIKNFIVTLSIKTLSIMPFSIMNLIVTLSIMPFSIITLGKGIECYYAKCCIF